MKKADIKTDGTAYLAKVSYNERAPVVPVKVGVERRRGHSAQQDGVLVRLPRAMKVEYQQYPEGAEVILGSRAIEREWTAADEAQRLAQVAASEKADDLRARFEEAGFSASRTRRWSRDDEDVDVVVKSHGVELTPAAAERLLDMVPEGQGAAFA